MAEEDINPNPVYLVPELLEEIFLRLPLKSILKFKTVSKQWRSILDSRRFTERRRMMNAQAKPKIMAAGGDRNGIQGRMFHGDKEVHMFYLHSDVASRPSLPCDSLVCVPVPGWVNVFNPSTGEFVRFPSGPDPVKPRYTNPHIDSLFDVFSGYWRMGFGRDDISGSYKIVRMCFNVNWEICCEILDVNNGSWQKPSPPPYEIGYRRRSTCVNGSIYWVEVTPRYKLLALDLHTEKWLDISLPLEAIQFQTSCQVTNLENRLVLASTYPEDKYWNVKIWGMNPLGGTWSAIYSIRLLPLEEEHLVSDFFHLWFWTRPVVVSKQGNLYIYDNNKRLFKYYPETDESCCIAENICVISPFVEDLVPLTCLDLVPKTRTYGLKQLDHGSTVGISNLFRRIDFMRPDILVTTTIVALIGVFCYRSG